MNRPPFAAETLNLYPSALLTARETAKEHGYAVGLHGSQTYDLDLIACPWVEKCSQPQELAFAIADKLGWFLHSQITSKPHGRQGFLIYGPHHAHIDLSVMPMEK